METVAYQMAMADGEISANEALILHLFTANMGLSPEKLAVSFRRVPANPIRG